MKAFLVASVIMLVIIALVISNSIVIHNRTEALLALCAQIQNGSAADELTSEWQSCRHFFLLSNHRDDIERADDALILMQFHDLESEPGRAALETFITAMKVIQKNQKFTFDTIF